VVFISSTFQFPQHHYPWIAEDKTQFKKNKKSDKLFEIYSNTSK